jgi:anti-sigma regulatory factor (Ser/Thr protein kinase)
MRAATAMQPTDQVPWPHRTALPLGALPTAPSCARGHVRSVVREWGLDDLADTAELVTSELVTNAVQASERLSNRGDPAVVPVIHLGIISDGISMMLQVWDASDEMPIRQNTTPDSEAGRGLMLVDTLAKDWGAYRKAEGGKVVWAMITTADP